MNSISGYLSLSYLATEGAQFPVEAACWFGLSPDCSGTKLVSVCCINSELVNIDTDSISNSGFCSNLGFYCDSLAYDKWCLLSLPRLNHFNIHSLSAGLKFMAIYG